MEVLVDRNFYWCEEISEKVIRNNAFLDIAPFSRWDMWSNLSVVWREYDVTRGWALAMSKRIVTYLRHQAPLRRNRAGYTSAMDRGGWIAMRDLATAMKLTMDELISILRAMSYDPKDRIQVAMLYRKEPSPVGPVWKNLSGAGPCVPGT